MKRVTISLSNYDAELLRNAAFSSGCKTPSEYISKLLHDAHSSIIEPKVVSYSVHDTTIQPGQLLQPAHNTTIRKIPAVIGRRTEGD